MSKNEDTSKPVSQDDVIPSKESTLKNKPKTRGRKRKRQSSDSSEYEDVLPDNTMEMEKNLHASALKNNLDDISVRKILKKVVTNDHVLALVKLREEEEDSGPEESSLRPKLTRAKVKELMKVSPKTATWNLELTPIKHIPVKTRPEVKALIAQELPEDEDDEEYEPTNDDVPSDDDQGLESCSDLDSQPRTPATPRSQHTASPQVVKDGPFKVPLDVSTPTRRKLDLEEEATIALRTRSKLSLSATSIEHIESTFIPPDDLPMPVVDNLWNEFLNECLNPASVSRHEDDDEADPEYNVAADPDAQDEDEEALGNSLIKISKKELNDLVTELFNIMPEPSTEELLSNSVLTDTSHTEVSTRWEGKQEPLSDDETRVKLSDRITFEKKNYTRMSIGKTEPADASPEVQKIAPRPVQKKTDSKRKIKQKRPPLSVSLAISEEAASGGPRAPPLLQLRLRPQRETVTIQIQDTACILPEQILILQQQLRQHIQLATSNFMQLYVHPIHWRVAPFYKECLESLHRLAATQPKSVVDVCNLRPAVELLRSWESTLAADTPDNTRMLEFVQKEIERSRRCIANKNSSLGEFPEMFKNVIANSPVFLYPYLLPSMPYRPDPLRRFSYHTSEDRLIAMGLDQFWDYIEKNPGIYKPPRNTHPRHRWGLGLSIQLVCKHMFPWITPKVMLAHVQNMRKLASEDNPIKKFFKNREIVPVKHKLLPFNPKMTLYEQPEHEVPRVWVRYLAKNSTRFKHFLYRRHTESGVTPSGGVDVHIGQVVQEPTKNPLPINFTKEIVSNRQNLHHREPPPKIPDKYDLQVQQTIPSDTTTPLEANIIINTPQINSQYMYKLVETSTGAFLMPIQSNTISVNCNTTPISSTTETVINDTKIITNNTKTVTNDTKTITDDVKTITDDVKTITDDVKTITIEVPKDNRTNKEKDTNSDHCTCCILLRKICKIRQTSILDYFGKKSKFVCECRQRSYPKVSNRLKLLVRNYKNNYKCTLETLKAKLTPKNTKSNDESNKEDVPGNVDYNQDDIDYVNLFHVRLLTRLAIHRDTRIKNKVNTVLFRYNPHSQDPIELMNKLYEACGIELVDVYKEFLGFLTPEQADKMNVFRDHFLRNGVPDIVKKIEEQIQNTTDQKKMFKKLHAVFYSTKATACEICTDILSAMEGYPNLARYVFSLFPHRKVTSKPPPVQKIPTEEPPMVNGSAELEKQSGASGQSENIAQVEKTVCDDTNKDLQMDESTHCDDLHLTMDCEVDQSSDEDGLKETDNSKQTAKKEIKTENKSEPVTSMSVNFNPIITVSKTEVLDRDECSNSSMVLIFEEDSVKAEPPDWKREEDKVILQLLKEHVTPEERQDKPIVEIIQEKGLIDLIGQSLIHKSLDDVAKRVMYLLELLVLSEI